MAAGRALRVAVTGGIGAGKSSVSTLLAERGAVVVDADRIAREVVEPGTPGLAAVAEAFGRDVLTADGALDRAALGAVVFADPDARRRLEAITHPLVRDLSEARLAAVPPGAVAVYDVPLLAESRSRAGFDVVVVVRADPEVRVERLVGRGLTADDARARIAAQASDAEREALADVVVDNSGDRAALAVRVDALWSDLTARAGSAGG
ncbi:dephospho-CoA kinase [Jatrophihabitans sp. YIM 134969]